MKISAQLLFTHVLFIVAFEAFLFVQLAFIFLMNCISSTLSCSSGDYSSSALRFFAMYISCAALVLLFSIGYHYVMEKVLSGMRNSKRIILSTVIIGISALLGLLTGSFVQYVAIILNRIEVVSNIFYSLLGGTIGCAASVVMAVYAYLPPRYSHSNKGGLIGMAWIGSLLCIAACFSSFLPLNDIFIPSLVTTGIIYSIFFYLLLFFAAPFLAHRLNVQSKLPPSCCIDTSMR